MNKQYEGSVYIGVVGSTSDDGDARDSIVSMERRPGDYGPVWARGTKGYETRQLHVNSFIENKEFDFLFFVDHDMVFAPDTLERLRSHKLPYVAGFYMRRKWNPVSPVWYENFEYEDGDVFPMSPYLGTPDKDAGLIPIGASGWGCTLVHRDVFDAVRVLLKGEDEIIEDDMDVWPYDLNVVMGAINDLYKQILFPGTEIPRFADEIDDWDNEILYRAITTLKDEFRPLRGQKSVVGSDIRFPLYAKAAGYQLWGDPAIRPGHIIQYPVNGDDFCGLDPNNLEHMRQIKDEKIVTAKGETRTILEMLHNATTK